MTKRIVLCALLILLASGDFASGKVKRTAKKKIQKTTAVAQPQERYDEIDNFDFLYDNGTDELNLDYDIVAVNSLLDEAMSHLGAIVAAARVHTPSIVLVSPVMSTSSWGRRISVVRHASSMPATYLSAAVR